MVGLNLGAWYKCPVQNFAFLSYLDVNRISGYYLSGIDTCFCQLASDRLEEREDQKVMPSWLPAIPYSNNHAGYWDPITSTLNWCEEVSSST